MRSAPAPAVALDGLLDCRASGHLTSKTHSADPSQFYLSTNHRWKRPHLLSLSKADVHLILRGNTGMRKILLTLVASCSLVNPVAAQNAFTGDVKLACEAILCLSSGTRPNECAPSLKRYFSISFSRFSDTIKERTNFLNLCPAASQDNSMKSLVSAIANGAGRCDAQALNAQLMTQYSTDSNSEYSISDAMPAYCGAYTSHAYTKDLLSSQAVYVGIPERNGYWVERSGYAAALAEYRARIAREDANHVAAQNDGGG